MSLIIVGSVAFDAIETPHGKTDKILGGAGTYISLAASYLGVKPHIVSVVGNDFPNEYIELLQKHNACTEGLQQKMDDKTFFWSGKYHEDMNNRDTLATELNVLGSFDPIVPESYQHCNYLMLGNLQPQVQSTVISRLKKRPKLIVMDTMNFWMNIASKELAETISMVDVLTLNEEEARQLSGEFSLVKAARKILEMGPMYLVIKKGEHGALLFDKQQVFFAPAMPLESVFDPTGAGDTFAGGFIGYIAQKDDISFETMKSALIVGSALASFCVEKFGTERLQFLSKEEINQRIDAFVKLTKFQIPEL